MLVKLKRTVDNRWVIQALSGEFIGQEVGVAKSVRLIKGRLGTKHPTGYLNGIWDLEIPPYVQGSETLKNMKLETEPDTEINLPITREYDKWYCGDSFIARDVWEILVTKDGMFGKAQEGRPAFRGIPIKPETKKKGWFGIFKRG